MAATGLCAMAAVVVAMLVPAASAAPPDAQCHGRAEVCTADWPMAGQNISNTHAQANEQKLKPQNAHALAPRWTFTISPKSETTFPTDDVSATPTVANGVVYFPDWGGHLFAVDSRTGEAIWSHSIADYTGIAGTFSRTSPAVVGNLLILGDKPPSGSLGWGQGSGLGAHLIAVDARTGALVWITQVDTHFASQITASPVAFNDVAYVGVSSVEEITAINPEYACCSFRGSAVALDIHTGKVLWKTFVVPTGYSGGAIWGSSAAVDPVRGNLYVATGNNYSVPDAVQACVDAGGTNCVSPDNHIDSMLALDLRTGTIKWATGTLDFDNWTVACFIGQKINCPSPSSPDADFGGGPNLFTAGSRQLVGDGTKSGIYWALDPGTGQIVWANSVGPGGIFGGIQWGSSVADGRVYVALANSANKPVTLTKPAPGSAIHTTGGFWAALDAATGKTLWQQADPLGPTFGDIGQTATANGVVFGGSMDPQGHLYAMDGATGQILWRFAAGGSVASGSSIVDGTVYWGSGYSQFVTRNNKLFAFSLGGG